MKEVVGLARRVPSLSMPKTSWVQADVVRSDLTPVFEGADAVIHLAWLIPARPRRGHHARHHVEGSSRVFHAVGSAGVGTLVYASSVGTYSPAPRTAGWTRAGPSAESRPPTTPPQGRGGASPRPLELEHPDRRVCGYGRADLQRDAASEISPLFAGPFLPNPLVRPGLIPVLPVTERLVFQAVHAHDVGDAYRLAAVDDGARGPFNIAAEPVLDPPRLARLFRARPVKVPTASLWRAADLSWRLRLQPTHPSWLDLALETPLMDTTRAREKLGWRAHRSSEEALAELIDGIRESAASVRLPCLEMPAVSFAHGRSPRGSAQESGSRPPGGAATP